MSFVKDEQSAGPEFAEDVAQAGRIGFVGQEAVRNDEAGARAPRIRGETSCPPYFGDALAIDDSEGETEFRFEFIFPLRCHRRRRGHDNQVNPAAQEQFANNEPGLDGFSQPDVIGNQEVDAREAERLAQRKQLIGVEPDACAKWRLQQIAVACGRRIPANDANMGGEHLRNVRCSLTETLPRIVIEALRTDLGIPQYIEVLALSVI